MERLSEVMEELCRATRGEVTEIDILQRVQSTQKPQGVIISLEIDLCHVKSISSGFLQHF